MKAKQVIVAASTVHVGERINTSAGMCKVVKVDVNVAFTNITVEDPRGGGQTILSFGPTTTVLVEKAKVKP